MTNDTKFYKELVTMGEAFSMLPEEERIILLNRLNFVGKRDSLRKLATKLNISPERVRQKQEKALYKLEIMYETLNKKVQNS
ncbi:MAG: RNA polymerase factor sigma-32 [Euryarchaeota archaeon ADurb.Bin023]|jgi:DNA-directed RNA polymerase sigma subunit (sigma70/sigma32)|nr:MAG: RNA polymerase factor sigma-32 [Euryarchaeota archaeon ADurb.Bin023]